MGLTQVVAGVLVAVVVAGGCGDDDGPDYASMELGEVTVTIDTFWNTVRTLAGLASGACLVTATMLAS